MRHDGIVFKVVAGVVVAVDFDGFLRGTGLAFPGESRLGLFGSGLFGGRFLGGSLGFGFLEVVRGSGGNSGGSRKTYWGGFRDEIRTSLVLEDGFCHGVVGHGARCREVKGNPTKKRMAGVGGDKATSAGTGIPTRGSTSGNGIVKRTMRRRKTIHKEANESARERPRRW